MLFSLSEMPFATVLQIPLIPRLGLNPVSFEKSLQIPQLELLFPLPTSHSGTCLSTLLIFLSVSTPIMRALERQGTVAFLYFTP